MVFILLQGSLTSGKLVHVGKPLHDSDVSVSHEHKFFVFFCHIITSLLFLFLCPLFIPLLLSIVGYCSHCHRVDLFCTFEKKSKFVGVRFLS